MHTPVFSPDLSSPHAAMTAVVDYFEALHPGDVAHLSSLYCDDAFFKDPFNAVQGLPAIVRIFDHMFDTLHAPRFVITERVQDRAQCMVTWDFFFAPRSAPHKPMTIHGATHFVLREQDGVWRVAVHRDYWDAAEELYEKLPLLGSLMRWLKKKVASA